MTMAPGISLPQEECTKFKKVTMKGTFQSREQIQQVLMCTHYTDSMALTKPPKSKKVWSSNG